MRRCSALILIGSVVSGVACGSSGDDALDDLCDGKPSGALPLVWAQLEPGSSNSIAVPGDGGLVLAGQFSGSITFAAGKAGETKLDSVGGVDSFLARYTSDGALVWAKRFGGVITDGARGVAIAPDGSIVLTGSFDGTATFGDGNAQQMLVAGGDTAVFLARYTADGALMWARSVGGAAGNGIANGFSVGVAADGSIRVLGNFTGPATFGKGEAGARTLTSMTGNAGPDTFVARFEADGTFTWVTRSIGPYVGGGRAFTMSPDGSVFVSGTMYGTVQFFPGEASQQNISGGAGDLFLARYNGDGSIAWTAHSTGDTSQYNTGTALAVTSDDGVVLTGSYEGTVVFGAGEPNETAVTAFHTNDYLVARYTASGALDWVRVGGGPYKDAGSAIGVAADGTIEVAANFDDKVMLSPGRPDAMATSKGGGVLARYSGDGALATVVELDPTSEVVVGSMAVLPTGSVRLTGHFFTKATLGAGERNETMLTTPMGSDLVARYDRCP